MMNWHWAVRFFLVAVLSAALGAGCAHAPVAQVDPLESALDQFARDISESVGPERHKARVAIRPFKGEGKERFDRYLTEEITTRIAAMSYLQIIERDQIESALEELRLNQVDELFEKDNRVRFGQFIGAWGLVIGSYDVLPETVRVRARIFETATGKVVGSASADLPRTEELNKILTGVGRGGLTVESRSPRAAVYVNDSYKGEAGPKPLDLRLTPGKHELEVALEGYRSFSKRVRIQEGMDETVRVEFVRPESAPSKAAWGSVFLPGLGPLMYGEGTPQSYAAGATAIAFYPVLGLYMADAFGKNALCK